MDPIFKKLNFKEQEKIAVINPPDSFQQHLEAMKNMTRVQDSVEEGGFPFVLGFAEMAENLPAIYEGLEEALDANDPILWVAYPKKSSKKFKSDITRDSGHWGPLGEMGFEGVRSVSIDEDWSAIRFRLVDFIKQMKRSKHWAMSEKGKKRTSK